MAARTDAARAAAVASRAELAEEVARLEAAGRAAVDIPAKIRRAPAQTAGLAAGAAFIVAGGPKRLIRGFRRAVFGPEADLPKSMLPREVDKTLKKLGSDGDKVRGTLEREFASYLDEKAEELFTPKTAGPETFDAALQRARGRWSGARVETKPDEPPPSS